MRNPLFLSKQRDLTKVAVAKLDKNPDDWDTEVIEMLHEQHPYLTDSKINITFKKTDADTGSGIGQIVLDDRVSIPVVIQDFKLLPMDVFYCEGKLYPLRRETLESKTQKPTLGKTIKPGSGEASDVSMHGSNTAPAEGKYSFGENLHFDVSKLTDILTRGLNDDGLKYEVQANPLFRDILAPYVNKITLKKEAAKEDITWTSVEAGTFTKIAQPGIYEVMTSEGPKTGLVFKNLITVTPAGLVERNDSYLFAALDKTAHALVQGEIAGRPSKDKLILEDSPMVGRGIFWMVKEGTIVSTEPVEVMWSSGDKLGIRSSFGTTLTVERSDKFSRLEKIGSTLYMPKAWSFTNIGSPTVLNTVKVANLTEVGTAPVNVRYANSRFIVTTDDPLFNSFSRMGETYAESLQALNFLSKESAESLLKKAQDAGSVGVRILRKTAEAPKQTKLPVLTSEELSALIKTAAMLDPNTCSLMKLAEERAKETIDTLLGLNFLTDENISRFVEHLDKIAEAKQAVAELLLATKIGLDLDAMPLRTALFALDRIEQDLKELRNASAK